MKRKTLEYNHEVWHTCPNCDLEYDLRINTNCPNCGCKNEKL